MKKIKFILTIFIISTLTISLVGCSAGKRPSDRQILEDLNENYLNEYPNDNDGVDIKGFQIDDSSGGKKKYTATLFVTGKNKSGYTEKYWNVEIEYLKVDGAWKMKDCSWEYDSYEVVKYPSESEAVDIISNAYGAKVKIQDFSIDKDKSQINCRAITNIDWCEYGSGEVISNVILECNNTGWYLSSNKTISSKFSFNSSFDGNYSLKEGRYIGNGSMATYAPLGNCLKNGDIVISNAIGQKLDFSCTSLQNNSGNSTIHFDNIKDIQIKSKQIILTFIENDVVFNNNAIGTTHLTITLNKSSFPNGTVEITFLNSNFPLAYANNY